MADPDTALKLAMAHWQAMADLQVKFVTALAQYKTETAKAELVAAVAAGEWTVARAKARVVQELEASLKRLTRQRAATARSAARYARQARDLAKIRDGEELTPSQLALAWAAYRVFERAAPAATLEQIIDTPLHAAARLGSSYVDPRRPRGTCPDPPETVDNVYALIGWLKRRGYVPRRGSPAYRQVIGAIAAVAESARSQVQVLEKSLREMEQGTYDTWQPLVIVGLPDSVDARKIIKLGARS